MSERMTLWCEVRFVSLATCMSEQIQKLILPWIRLYFVGEIHTHFLLWLCSLHIIFRFTLKRFGVHFPFVSKVAYIVWLRKCFVHLLLLLSSFLCDPYLMILMLVLSCSPFSPFSKLFCEANNHQKVFDQWDHTFYVDNQNYANDPKCGKIPWSILSYSFSWKVFSLFRTPPDVSTIFGILNMLYHISRWFWWCELCSISKLFRVIVTLISFRVEDILSIFDEINSKHAFLYLFLPFGNILKYINIFSNISFIWIYYFNLYSVQIPYTYRENIKYSCIAMGMSSFANFIYNIYFIFNCCVRTKILLFGD